MSVKLMSAIFETEFRDMPDEEGNITKASTAKLVLLAMADHANDEGEGAYPSVETLSKKTALTAQTIRNTWGALKYNGVIYLQGTSKYRTNNHTINTQCFPRLRGEKDGIITLNSLEGQMSEVEPSNGSLLTLNPLDPNHQLTTNKTSLPLSIENAIAVNQPVTAEMVNQETLRDVAPKMFEKALGFSKPLPWWSNRVWTEFAQWVCERYDENRFAFGEYNIWRNTPYTKGGLSNTRLRGFPAEFYDSWDMFLMSKPHQTDEQRPEYQPYPYLDGDK